MLAQKNIYKRFVALVTVLKNRYCSRPVLTLTACYSLAALTILVLFTAVVYVLYANVLPLEIEEEHVVAPMWEEFTHEPLAHELRENLMHVLILTDVVLFALSVVASYFGACMVLRPIQAAREREQRFLVDAAHELKTPVAVLLAGSSYLASHTPTPKEYDAFGDMVLRTARHMRALVDDLMTVSKHRTRVVSTQEVLNLATLVHTIVQDMQPYAVERQCKLTMADSAHTLRIAANPTDMTRVLHNLVKNAIDYNKPNGSVTVSLTQNGTMATLQVSDTGVGMTESFQKRIFEPFFTGEHGHTHLNGGTGLGLALVYEVINAYGGSVAIESSVGLGTTVRVMLPLAPPHVDDRRQSLKGGFV